MTVVYSSRYAIDIGMHVFPTAKYGRVFEEISRHGFARVIEPEPAAWEQLALVHTPAYLSRIQSGALPLEELAQLEIPWTPEITEGFRLMTGGTILGATLAASGKSRMVFHVGGGFHHAFPNHGEGFCLFNDVAAAIQVLLAAGSITRAAVIDLDVHHGNGTAFTFMDDGRVFTFSMHQENNYPARKPTGSLDIGLPDGASDDLYLRELQDGLDAVFASSYDLVFYLAGADPYREDQLGGLALSKEGLRRRDRLVLEACARRGLPVVILLAGGYARRLEDTVDIHVATFEEAVSVDQQR